MLPAAQVLHIAYDYEYTTSQYCCLPSLLSFLATRLATGPNGFKGPIFSRAMIDRGYRSLDELSATRLQVRGG